MGNLSSLRCLNDLLRTCFRLSQDRACARIYGRAVRITNTVYFGVTMTYRVKYRTAAGKLLEAIVLAPSMSEAPIEVRDLCHDVAEIIDVQRIAVQ